MTKFDNKFVPNTPKTFQVLELKDQQVKKSPLSPVARAKVINRSGSNYLSESKDYGPCSYSGCPYPNVPFSIELSVEGNSRNWARRPNTGTFLPGNWTWNFNDTYLYRQDLWLTDIDQAQRVDPLIVNDSLYVVNMVGQHCFEDSDFCNCALEVIRKSISHHERGGEVRVNETITSEISEWSRWGLRVVGSTAVGIVFGPGAGAGAYLASEASRIAGVETSASRFLGDVGRSVENIASDFASGIAEEFGGSLPSFGYISAARDMLEHSKHCGEGRRYDSNCPICKPW